MVPRILLVEDEAGLRLTLTDRLGSEGYSVETAADGEAGLACATSGGYDLIVLDVMLPRMNGFDVCREVRQRGVTTPILMLTARGQVVDKVVGLKLGATLSRDALLSDVWGYDEMPLTRTVDVHVAGLRQKIEANPKAPEYIVTVHGLGYKFVG